MHRISLEVYSFNPRARRVYEKAGFRAEGVLRESLRYGGQWIDATVMSILESEWAEHHGRPSQATRLAQQLAPFLVGDRCDDLLRAGDVADAGGSPGYAQQGWWRGSVDVFRAAGLGFSSCSDPMRSATMVDCAMPVDFGDLPTWIASVGTVGALFLALKQIQTERQRRLERERKDRDELHRSQAQLISAVAYPAKQVASGDDPVPLDVLVINNSSAPIYRLVVGIVYFESGSGPTSLEETLQRGQQTGRRVPVSKASSAPTGNTRVPIGKTGSDVPFGEAGAEVAFTNNEGCWIRRATGELKELPEQPFEYFKKFGLSEEYHLEAPEEP